MVFYGQDTGCKLQENHDELGVLLPLKKFEHNILHHLEQVDGIVLRCREEMIHQAGTNQLRERPELAIFLTIFLGFWLGKLRIDRKSVV